MILALAGGVGGGKLVYGLSGALPPEELSVVVNTGDDLIIHSLYVSPDLDTIMYTLSGLANPSTGWGIREDTFSAAGMLARYGKETWFNLGDQDIATHLVRKELLESGKRLTEVTRTLARALGVRADILPMTDARVATKVLTDDGELDFQDYFVRRRWQDAVRGIRYDGIESASVPTEVIAACKAADLVVLCPSNPFVSLGPILAVPGMRQTLRKLAVPIVAVSPIVGGSAVSGPAGRMMEGLGHEVSSFGVARLYADFLDGMVVDRSDELETGRIRALGIEVLCANTIMKCDADKTALAQDVVEFGRDLRRKQKSERPSP